MSRAGRVRGGLLAGVLLLPGGLLVLPVGAQAASGDCVRSGLVVTCTYTATGGEQAFTVPGGVSSVQVVVEAGAGGANNFGSSGRGGRAEAPVPVVPGAVLTLVVGRQGERLRSHPDVASGGYGFGAGGDGGGSLDEDGNTGCGGGGGSALLLGDEVLLVAGGGGGSATAGFGDPAGGEGGGTAGASGSGGRTGSSGGQPGTQSGAGAAGSPGGASGSGHDGGDGGVSSAGGGGGGGGWFGGGGGGGGQAGGGGGSGYASPLLASAALTSGVRTGDGQITISYAVPLSATTVSSLSGSGQSVLAGTAFADPLVAQVTDSAAGLPVPGVPVVFSVASGSASFAGGSTSGPVLTDENGQAVSTVLTAGSTPGPVTVSASTPAVSGSATFDLSVAGSPASISGSPPVAGVGEPYSFAFTVGGNPEPAVSSPGPLPPGLALNEDGVLSGTPSRAGSYPFSVSADNGMGEPASRQVTLVVRGLPALRVQDRSVVEGASGLRALVLPVVLSRTSSVPVQVRWTTADGSAKAASDYVQASGVLGIPAGSSTGRITVQVRGDRLREQSEVFSVLLTGPSGARIADGVGSAGIANDD